jgi:hypothetical protein
VNKAQIYLLNAGIDDVVVSGGDDIDPENWKYLSDVMGEYHLSASQPAVLTSAMHSDGEKQCNCVSGRAQSTGGCPIC